MKHKQKKATIMLKMDGDKFTGRIEGTKEDLVYLLVHCVEENKNLEDILLGALQILATTRIVEALTEKEQEDKLKKGTKTKN